jgi:hypothetical protein
MYQYNHIACLIQFGLLHKMKWSSRTSSTEVARRWGKSNNSISTLKHPSLFLNKLLYYPQWHMLHVTQVISLLTSNCCSSITIYPHWIVSCAINNTTSGNHKTSSYGTHSGLLYQKWNEIEQRSGEVWDQFIHEKNMQHCTIKICHPSLLTNYCIILDGTCCVLLPESHFSIEPWHLIAVDFKLYPWLHLSTLFIS